MLAGVGSRLRYAAGANERCGTRVDHPVQQQGCGRSTITTQSAHASLERNLKNYMQP
jgi:hypothetical protein